MSGHSGHRPRFNLYYIFKSDQEDNSMPETSVRKLHLLIHAILTSK